MKFDFTHKQDQINIIVTANFILTGEDVAGIMKGEIKKIYIDGSCYELIEEGCILSLEGHSTLQLKKIPCS